MGTQPARGSFAEDKERPIPAQGYAVGKLEVPKKDGGLLNNGVIFQ